MWLQDARRFRLAAPSCDLHIPAISFAGYLTAFPLAGPWRFLIAHVHLCGISGDLGSSLQVWLYAGPPRSA